MLMELRDGAERMAVKRRCLAILGLPQMRFLTGSLAGSLGLLSSIALVFAGIAWLVAVELFIRFFDQYLSRN